MAKSKKKVLFLNSITLDEKENNSLFDFGEEDNSRNVETIAQVSDVCEIADFDTGYDAAVKKNRDKRKEAEENEGRLWALNRSVDKDDDLFNYNLENEKKIPLSETYSVPKPVEAKVISERIPEMQCLPVVRAKAVLTKDVVSEEQIIKDRSLRIAKDFINKEHLIIVDGEICWYNGTFYRKLSERELQGMIFERYYEELSKGNSLTILSNAAKLVTFCIKKQLDEFPLNTNLVIFTNGTLEVDTKRFRQNSYKDLANSALGIKYNPSCLSMPNTKMFLETIADGDEELYELLLQVIGYILSNDTKAKAFFYLEGVGDAGKSRFCDLIASFFPTSGTNKVARIALQDLGGKFSLGNLVNAKLNISEDLPDKALSVITVSKIKMLSDGNRQEAEAKYVQKFSFRPTCKFLFASNHPLKLKEYDQAFVDRVVYVPFLKAIPKHKQDRNILEKMQIELPALFNHAIDAYKRLVASGYCWAGTERFKPRIEITNAGIIVNKMAELRKFVEKCCDFERDYITATSELQEEYLLFCQKYNYSPILGDRFSRELIEVLPDSVTRVKIGNQRRGFKGIRILHPYSEDGFQ
ncbi:MAG: hypothetical protein IJO65_05080 [Lachnospiraceae bacterium]|nr:hypothetical protein [Lachnospiraceae bacterium]